MEGSNGYDDPSSASQVLDSTWLPDSPPSFHGKSISSTFNFEVDHAPQIHFSDEKRRLTPTQVRLLEKSFEVENKLDPDRKLRLARELGLQPQQVAIWFQNRRARCKTKVLEKEYDSLKASYDKLKEDRDCLLAGNEKLKNEVRQLTRKLVPNPTSDVFDSESSLHDSSEYECMVKRSSKIEVECYDDLQPNSCNFGFPVQDHGTWFWKY